MYLSPLIVFTSLVAWIYLAVARGMFWHILLPRQDHAPASLPSVDIIVPARNEAGILPQSLPSLLAQDYAGAWQIILVDDHSGDGTAAVAKKIAAEKGKEERLKIISAPDLPMGWTGKVAAMNAGVIQSNADMILFTDADIRHDSYSLRHLVVRAEAGKIDLVSRMVLLNCQSVAEKFLIPAFVFFFAMLYPFRLANSPNSRVAAAAGGTILLRRKMLDKIGGLEVIKSALIDDCSLARAVKEAHGKIELTLTRSIESLRPYPHIKDVWRMVARTAYTQLGYSPSLLAGTIIGMSILYLAPVLFVLFAPSLMVFTVSVVVLVIMAVLYGSIVRFYDLPWVWALTLPAAALVYGAATIDSARLFYKGKGGQWKGRVQA